MPAKIDRTGEYSEKMNAIIIGYRNAMDIDVKFLTTGSIVEHKTHNSFKRGWIHDPAVPALDRTGEMNTVLNAVIVGYRNAHDIDVKFLTTGSIVEHKAYKSFKNNEIYDPKTVRSTIKTERVGEEKENKYGERMKIVAYRKCSDVDVEIEGEILTHQWYQEFTRGNLHSSKINPCIKSRVGEVHIFPNGEQATIIEYFHSTNITVQFSDGLIIKNLHYNNFINGSFSRPDKLVKKRMGELNKNMSGYEMKIVGFRNPKDIDVEFTFDGSVVYNTTYTLFRSGKIAHPSCKRNLENMRDSRIGEKATNSQGLTLEIIDYRNASDLDVKVLETGEIIKNRSHRDFSIGGIFSQNYFISTLKEKHVMSTSGLFVKIKEYRSATDVDYEFEDGVIVSNKHSRYIKNGKICHPGLHPQYKRIFHGFETSFAWREEDKVYYKCRCLNCMTEQTIMTPQEMLAHKCTKED